MKSGFTEGNEDTNIKFNLEMIPCPDNADSNSEAPGIRLPLYLFVSFVSFCAHLIRRSPEF
jgi:hypothetical protein